MSELLFGLQLLEKLLPPRKQEALPTGDNVEEVMLSEYDPHTAGRSNSRGGHGGEAYHEDDDDDDMGGAPRMQCAQQ